MSQFFSFFLFSGHVLCVGTFGLKLGTCVRLLCFCGGPRAREGFFFPGPLSAAAESSALFSDSHRFPMAVKPCGQSLISAAAVFPREEIGGGENPTETREKIAGFRQIIVSIDTFGMQSRKILLIIRPKNGFTFDFGFIIPVGRTLISRERCHLSRRKEFGSPPVRKRILRFKDFLPRGKERVTHMDFLKKEEERKKFGGSHGFR